jgi:hypothetical protein
MEKRASIQEVQGLFSHSSIHTFSLPSQSILSQIATCHTHKMGYHLYQCNEKSCGELKQMYHSCGNRHCLFCGNMKREQWMEDRKNELLPTAYYHVVFTLPHELNPMILGNRKTMFTVMFDHCSKTLLNHGNNAEFLGAEVGITMILHTWSQDLGFHPHVHCIVTGGGCKDGKWIAAKRENSKFLFPTISLSKMFKAMMIKTINKNTDLKWENIEKEKVIKSISGKVWNVYAKAPFGGPAQVIEYLGRYTHKVAISRHRILKVGVNDVTFTYKDYADHSKTKVMSLSKTEFLRRFELHLLPRGFVKIRHTGFLRNRFKSERINDLRTSVGLAEAKPKVAIPVKIMLLEKYGRDISICPCCQKGTLVLIADTRPKKHEKPNKINIMTKEPAPV